MNELVQLICIVSKDELPSSPLSCVMMKLHLNWVCLYQSVVEHSLGKTLTNVKIVVLVYRRDYEDIYRSTTKLSFLQISAL